MTQGARIKYIRNQRGLTQKGLGILCGFPENSADVRIRQYESNTKSPKKDTLTVLAQVLKINYIAIENNDFSSTEDIMETLFWLDNGDLIDFFELQPSRDKTNDWRFKGNYNSNIHVASSNPFGLVFRDDSLNGFFDEWGLRKKELKHCKITQLQYNNWKWNWPYSCDDIKDNETYVDWMEI